MLYLYRDSKYFCIMKSEYLIMVMLLISILIVILYYGYLEKLRGKLIKKKKNYENFTIMDKKPQKDDGKACTMVKCSSIDPVSDPKYNMHQIVKQSILLEEHLANKNKRCRDCITKHFSHIIGLAEEAIMLACSDIKKFPLMGDLGLFYNKLFDKWLKDTSTSLDVCAELRTMRKKIIQIYFFDEEYKLEKTDDKGV